MGCRARGNAERRRASSAATMAGCTSTVRSCGAVHVLSVIEFDVETLIEFCRKTFHRRVAAVHVRVTDDTHRHGGRYKLPGVATDTGLVFRKTERGGDVFALMTGTAGERSMTLAGVLEA